MICAEDEIGVGKSHSGIIVLEKNAKVGDSTVNYLNPLDDTTFDISLTPNRADAASHLGVARDIKAITGEKINLPDISSFKNQENSKKLQFLQQHLIQNLLKQLLALLRLEEYA